LPGDYNSNGSVDAGDYVVWRKTLASTTNLQADGSGPTVGVPNGVVDQADYTYWRSNFGAVGAISAAGSGAGELLVGQGLGEPLLAASSGAEQPVAVQQEATVDTAVTDFSPSAARAATTSRPVLRLSSSDSATSATDSLLSIIRSVAASRSFDDIADRWHDSSADACDAIDQLFASLGGGHVVTEVGLLSTLI
jgi:hypothetical protein